MLSSGSSKGINVNAHGVIKVTHVSARIAQRVRHGQPLHSGSARCLRSFAPKKQILGDSGFVTLIPLKKVGVGTRSRKSLDSRASLPCRCKTTQQILRWA